MKRRILILIIVVVMGILLYCAAMMWLNRWTYTDLAETKKAMLAVEHICPQGSQETVARWSELGYCRYCVDNDGRKTGRFVAWENQRLIIEGYYRDGRKDGRWTVYNDDGTIYRLSEYDHGTEISDQIISRNQ
jgi:hypothetical protein